MNSLKQSQKISFLKIIYSFMNMDGIFDKEEEAILTLLKTTIFNLDIKDSQFKTYIDDIHELHEEFSYLDHETQKSLIEIIEEIIEKNQYDKHIFRKSDKHKLTLNSLNALKEKLNDNTRTK